MPRTLRTKKPQRTLTGKRPQVDDDGRSTKKPGSPTREANGRFARGNPGGPGNPHARFSAGMLTIARQTMTPEKIAAVFESIYIKALSGDMTAAKLILHYTIGKPGDAPHPDHLERDEWDLYQKNAMTLAEMQQAMGGLPCSLGNEIVSTALPAMTQARANELAAQLRGEGTGAPGKRKNEGTRRKEEPNGRRHGPASESTQDHAATAVDPWDVDSAPPSTNRKSTDKKSTADPSTRPQPPTTNSRVHDSRFTNQDSRDSRSTIHAPKAPIGNGVSNGSSKTNKRRKLVGKQWLQPLARKLTGGKQKRKKRRVA